VAWADKFRVELSAGQVAPESWLLRLFRRTRLLSALVAPPIRLLRRIAVWRGPRLPVMRVSRPNRTRRVIGDWLWYSLVALLTLYVVWQAAMFITASLGWGDLLTVVELGAITLVRVALLIALATLIWLPLGSLIGLRPRLAEMVQPLAQFLAAFPANLLFPIAVVLIVRFRLNPDIWLSFLMILGTQWYILFNVVAGASVFPNDLKEAAANFHIRGWQWWRSVILPGVFSYYITGAITASGGSWNASIVSESVSWGSTKVTAHGLGTYIAQATDAGDFPRIMLGIAVMSAYVILFNRLLWRPLYRYAERRFRLG
jgi:NitT/TauT family transport system permease protein